MAALGRILQIFGWLWMAVSFVGPMVGIPRLNFLPGLIFVFVARVMRTQAARKEMPDLGGTVPRAEPEPAPDRALNTKRNDLLEQIVDAGREATTDDEVSPAVDMRAAVGGPQQGDVEVTRPLTSAEMLARAHERWDSKPR